MSAKDKLKSYLLGKTEETPPEGVGVNGTLIREVLDAKQAEILGAVTGALDERLKAFDPMLASFKADEEKRKEEEEDAKALAKINERRIARGLPPLVAEKDDDDMDDGEKKSPGRHPKKSKKGEEDNDKKENPFEKKDDDKDARISKLEGEIVGLKNAMKVGASFPDPFDVSSLSGDDNIHTLTAGGTPRKIPYEKSWKWVLGPAISIRGGLQSVGDMEAVNELDLLVGKTRIELTEAGIGMPSREAIQKIVNQGV